MLIASMSDDWPWKKRWNSASDSVLSCGRWVNATWMPVSLTNWSVSVAFPARRRPDAVAVVDDLLAGERLGSGDDAGGHRLGATEREAVDAAAAAGDAAAAGLAAGLTAGEAAAAGDAAAAGEAAGLAASGR